VSISRWSSIVIVVILAASSCRKSLPKLDGIDKNLWASDKNGCRGERLALKTALKSQASKLKALTETEIVTLLGSPDGTELYSRNQKFYYYSISPAADCSGARDSTISRLVIRFNAMGLAKNVNVEE
jgi:hypothetical protein